MDHCLHLFETCACKASEYHCVLVIPFWKTTGCHIAISYCLNFEDFEFLCDPVESVIDTFQQDEYLQMCRAYIIRNIFKVNGVGESAKDVPDWVDER